MIDFTLRACAVVGAFSAAVVLLAFTTLLATEAYKNWREMLCSK